MLDEASPVGGIDDRDRETLRGENAVALHRAAFDLPHLQRENLPELAEVVEAFAPVDRAQDLRQ